LGPSSGPRIRASESQGPPRAPSSGPFPGSSSEFSPGGERPKRTRIEIRGALGSEGLQPWSRLSRLWRGQNRGSTCLVGRDKLLTPGAEEPSHPGRDRRPSLLAPSALSALAPLGSLGPRPRSEVPQAGEEGLDSSLGPSSGPRIRASESQGPPRAPFSGPFPGSSSEGPRLGALGSSDAPALGAPRSTLGGPRRPIRHACARRSALDARENLALPAGENSPLGVGRPPSSRVSRVSWSSPRFGSRSSGPPSEGNGVSRARSPGSGSGSSVSPDRPDRTEGSALLCLRGASGLMAGLRSRILYPSV